MSMINRLVAENTLKVPFKGDPYFTTNKKLLAFRCESSIRIKNLTRQAKDIEVPFANLPLKFVLSQAHPYLLLLTSAHLLQIHQVEYLSGLQEGSSRKIAILHNVEEFSELEGGLVIVGGNKTVKVLSYTQVHRQTEINLNIDVNALKSVGQVEGDFTLTTSPKSQKFFLTKCSSLDLESAVEPKTEIYEKIDKSDKYQKALTLTYLRQILAVYKDRYVFQRSNDKEVEIMNIEESKQVGKFDLEGVVRYSELKDNLLVMVISKDNTDYFHFMVLQTEPNPLLPLITNRGIYEKGRGDYYGLANYPTTQASQILDRKKNNELHESSIAKVSQTTSSMLFIMSKSKEKVQLIKLDHSKLLKSTFGEEKVNRIVYSRKEEGQQFSSQRVQVERARIHSSIELKGGEKSLEEVQKRFVQNLIDGKLKKVMQQFSELQKKVEKLQRVISGIGVKIQENFDKINRQQIKDNVEKLFDKLTPQFEKYFADIFKQVAGVLDQGVSYYNMKLAKEADMHKEALAQIVTQTFRAAQDIKEIGRKEQTISEKTEEHLRKLLEAKKKWTKSTEEFQERTKDSPAPSLKPRTAAQNSSEGKVFVRADLNFPSGKRQT